MTGGSFNIQNSVFIGGQPTTTPPISLSTSTAGVFSFNTVVGYTNTGTAIGGIDCGGGPTQPIDDSIVSGNTQQSNTQFGSKCALANTVVGSTDTTPGGIKVDPVFKPSDAYHLMVGSNPSIVNQLTSGPAYDVDDIARPLNAKWDIGADEAE